MLVDDNPLGTGAIRHQNLKAVWHWPDRRTFNLPVGPDKRSLRIIIMQVESEAQDASAVDTSINTSPSAESKACEIA